MKINEPVTTCRVVNNQAFYSLSWSPILKVDKISILNYVPSMSGLFELYYRDAHKNLVCFLLSRVWYGGLRGTIREATDPLIVLDEERKRLLENRECFYRFTVVNSFQDILDLMNILAIGKVAPERVPAHSGRYDELYLQEETPDKLITY